MYDKLDSLIFNNIKNAGEASLMQAIVGDAAIEAQFLACLMNRDKFRVIDGRLQALRKRGLIRYVGGAWRVA